MEDVEVVASEVIDAAIFVHMKLGCGFYEKIYEKALVIELTKRGLRAEAQKELEVYYDEVLLGTYNVDIIVEGSLILELKASEQTSKEHFAQLLHYLRADNQPLGLLLNFGTYQLGIKRAANKYFSGL